MSWASAEFDAGQCSLLPHQYPGCPWIACRLVSSQEGCQEEKEGSSLPLPTGTARPGQDMEPSHPHRLWLSSPEAAAQRPSPKHLPASSCRHAPRAGKGETKTGSNSLAWAPPWAPYCSHSCLLHCSLPPWCLGPGTLQDPSLPASFLFFLLKFLFELGSRPNMELELTIPRWRVPGCKD